MKPIGTAGCRGRLAIGLRVLCAISIAVPMAACSRQPRNVDGERIGANRNPSGHSSGNWMARSAALLLTAAVDQTTPTKKDSPDSPLFVGWPNEPPDAALVLTGEMHGYMRPCGCSPGQSGGLARRAGFLKYLAQERNWPTLPIDLGDIPGSTKILEKSRYEHSIRALHAMGTTAIGVGPLDLGIGTTTVLGWAANVTDVRFLASNLNHVNPDDQETLDAILGKLAVANVGPLKIGITCVVGDEHNRKLADPGLMVANAAKSAGLFLQQLKEQGADCTVLLAHMSSGDAMQLAKIQPGFDLVVCRSTYDDSAREEARAVGSTLVVWVGRKGKSVGVVGIWQKAKPRLRFDIVPLDPRFVEDAAINTIYARYVQDVKEGGLIDKWPRAPEPDGNQYVGDDGCRNCHNTKKRPIFDHWKRTGHAHAMETLEKKATPRGQDFNPECVLCHVVGFGYKTGYRSMEATPHFAGVQCESCHGPGGKHVDEETEKGKDEPRQFRPAKFRDAGAIRQLCVSCHDAENDLDFDFDRDYPKVIHPGSTMPAK